MIHEALQILLSLSRQSGDPRDDAVKLATLFGRHRQLVLVAQVVDLALLVRLVDALGQVVGGAVLQVLGVERELGCQCGRQCCRQGKEFLQRYRDHWNT